MLCRTWAWAGVSHASDEVALIIRKMDSSAFLVVIARPAGLLFIQSICGFLDESEVPKDKRQDL